MFGSGIPFAFTYENLIQNKEPSSWLIHTVRERDSDWYKEQDWYREQAWYREEDWHSRNQWILSPLPDSDQCEHFYMALNFPFGPCTHPSHIPV